MSTPRTGPTVETGLVYAHGLAALATLFISVGFGILASIQLLAPDTAAEYRAAGVRLGPLAATDPTGST